MLKLLILLVVALVALLWFTKGRLRGQGPAKGQPNGAAGASGAAEKNGPATIVACAHCGVHLPQSDAVTDGAGVTYCGLPHRLAGKR